MTAKKKNPKAKGRPTAYRPEYADEAVKLCLLGATDANLGDFFGVSEQTINAWKKKHPDFLESLKDGKEKADANVASSLYRTAMNGNTTAQIFWLKNRKPDAWRDKHDVDHTTQGDKINATQIIFKDPPPPPEAFKDDVDA